MEKLLIVDGSNLLFQMFYGMPARITGKDGRPIQGVLGFIGALRKILNAVHPDYLAVLFDGEHTNIRNALDMNYKSNRTDFSILPEEETPFSQLPYIYAALDHLQIHHAETSVCEADDWIAAYARSYDPQMEIVIVSQDSDFFQLITEHTSVLRYRGKQSTICDYRYITQTLGILPEQYADFKSLTGDTADNIQGIKGIGPKTAAALIQEFGSLEKMICNIDSISRETIRTSVQCNVERLQRNYQLILLTGDAEVPFSLASLRYKDVQYATMEVLSAIGLR